VKRGFVMGLLVLGALLVVGLPLLAALDGCLTPATTPAILVQDDAGPCGQYPLPCASARFGCCPERNACTRFGCEFVADEPASLARTKDGGTDR
jgi:hypothetical protein